MGLPRADSLPCSSQKPAPAKAEPKPKKLAAKVRVTGKEGGREGEEVVEVPGGIPPPVVGAGCLNAFNHLHVFLVGTLI